MKGFTLYSSNYRPLDAENVECIDCQDGLHRIGKEPVQPAYFGFACPIRPGDHCSLLRLRGGPADDGTRPTWQWNGDRINPTMIPSINCLSHNPANPSERYAGCGWHGWITNGATTSA